MQHEPVDARLHRRPVETQLADLDLRACRPLRFRYDSLPQAFQEPLTAQHQYACNHCYEQQRHQAESDSP
jgi:hypothetical protein